MVMDVKQDRLELKKLLSEYTDNVYFAPPANTYLNYPCIIITIDNATNKYTDNSPYQLEILYQVKYLSKDPIDNSPYKILKQIPYTSFVNEFSLDSIQNTILNIRRTI